jgi:hypothetical protein
VPIKGILPKEDREEKRETVRKKWVVELGSVVIL